MAMEQLKHCAAHVQFVPKCSPCVLANTGEVTATQKPTNGGSAAQRMDLSNSTPISVVTTASGEPAQRIVAYGTDGVGKTTFGAMAKKPGFICAEMGLNRKLMPSNGADLDLLVFPVPSTWEDVVALAWNVATQEHDRETVVLDTMDWAEGLLFEHLSREAGVKTIEQVGGGWQKGYTASLQEQRRLIAALDACHKRGMHVIVLFHAKQYTVTNPLGDDYDTFDLSMWTGKNSNAANLWRQWADDVLYMTFDIRAAKMPGDKGKAKVIDTGDARFIRTRSSPAYAAKNRNSLPDPLPLSWEDYIEAVIDGLPEPYDILVKRCEEKIEALPKNIREKAQFVFDQVRGDPGRLAQLSSQLSATLEGGQR